MGCQFFRTYRLFSGIRAKFEVRKRVVYILNQIIIFVYRWETKTSRHTKHIVYSSRLETKQLYSQPYESIKIQQLGCDTQIQQGIFGLIRGKNSDLSRKVF